MVSAREVVNCRPHSSPPSPPYQLCLSQIELEMIGLLKMTRMIQSHTMCQTLQILQFKIRQEWFKSPRWMRRELYWDCDLCCNIGYIGMQCCYNCYVGRLPSVYNPRCTSGIRSLLHFFPQIMIKSSFWTPKVYYDNFWIGSDPRLENFSKIHSNL